MPCRYVPGWVALSSTPPAGRLHGLTTGTKVLCATCCWEEGSPLADCVPLPGRDIVSSLYQSRNQSTVLHIRSYGSFSPQYQHELHIYRWSSMQGWSVSCQTCRHPKGTVSVCKHNLVELVAVLWVIEFQSGRGEVTEVAFCLPHPFPIPVKILLQDFIVFRVLLSLGLQLEGSSMCPDLFVLSPPWSRCLSRVSPVGSLDAGK